MTNFYSATFSFLEPVRSTGTVEAESPDDAVQKIRNFFSHVQDLEIHEVTLLEQTPEEITPKGKKPTLRVVH